jgi:putative ABC transport system ATP-binding protein
MKVSYHYNLAQHQIPILNELSHTFEAASFTSIQAPSGSGKTTLLNILGLLDKPTQGQYLIENKEIIHLNDAAKSLLRAKTFGFLFQNFRLIPNRNVLDNIMISLDIAGYSKQYQKEKSLSALEDVGLADRAAHLPPELSGGEAQRVAFARAIAKQPKVLLADEPTGNLDRDNRDLMLSLISRFNQSGGTVIMVTHDPVAAQRASQSLYLRNSSLYNNPNEISIDQ